MFAVSNACGGEFRGRSTHAAAGGESPLVRASEVIAGPPNTFLGSLLSNAKAQPDYGLVKDWLPVDIDCRADVVRWMRVAENEFSEPFFNDTVAVLRARTPAVPEVETSVSTLKEVATGWPSVRPAGVIYHMSRCGSTLVANALKLSHNSLVLPEANPCCCGESETVGVVATC